MRVKPQLPKDRKLEVLPMLMVHGWPGSIVEFQKIIPLLTTPRPDQDFIFELIIPSLPGFGYSDAATKVGMGPVEMAHVLKNLMLRLGFEKFYTQGGDWGAQITSHVAAMYPQHVLGMHSNLCMVMNPWSIMKMAAYNMAPWLFTGNKDQVKFPISKFLYMITEEGGYFHIQATKPETIGIAMSDSPTGLAAYILEKFSTGTNINNKRSKDGNLLEKYNMDELIDNIMMYWVPNKATSSFRIYAEYASRRHLKYRMDTVPIAVPSACAQFPYEIIYQTPDILRDRYVNLVRVTQFPEGGHFAAMELPQTMADDIWASVQTMREFESAKEKETLQKQKS